MLLSEHARRRADELGLHEAHVLAGIARPDTVYPGGPEHGTDRIPVADDHLRTVVATLSTSPKPATRRFGQQAAVDGEPTVVLQARSSAMTWGPFRPLKPRSTDEVTFVIAVGASEHENAPVLHQNWSSSGFSSIEHKGHLVGEPFHTLTRTSVAFDDPNLVSSAGLVPVMALADAAGLPDLSHERLTVATGQGRERRVARAVHNVLGSQLATSLTGCRLSMVLG